MRAALTVLLFAISLAAQADEATVYVTKPPASYDHPFEGQTLVVRNIPVDRLQDACAKWKATSDGKPFSGCSFSSPDGQTCVIFMRDDGIAYEWREQLLRHETAHCNGWPADHPKD